MRSVRGKLIRGVGGLYTVYTEDGLEISCRARGVFRHEGQTPLTGDDVLVSLAEDGTEEARISELLPRKNSLLRPAMANLSYLFLICAAREPDPSLRFLDKLLSILEHEGIEPVLIVTKSDLDPERAGKLCLKYRKCGFSVFSTDAVGSGDEEIRAFLRSRLGADSVSAFSGVSGAGKSTLLNRLFPSLSLETGVLSEKIARGKHTTRTVELYPLSRLCDGFSGFLADTPGFSMLDFERFDFFSVEDLPLTFREFVPYLGTCRYTKCTHIREDGCAILAAVEEKIIPRSRHTSYAELFAALKDKHEWK